MQITKFTDLSLRVLMYLTQNSDDSVVTINEIAQQFDVPRNHLIKVVTRLNKLNWVLATRGRNGGVKLAIHATKLKLGDILKELENKPSLVNCSEPPCVLAGRCSLKHALDNGLKAFYQEMNQYTLSSLIDKKTQSAVIQLHQQYNAAA